MSHPEKREGFIVTKITSFTGRPGMRDARVVRVESCTKKRKERLRTSRLDWVHVLVSDASLRENGPEVRWRDIVAKVCVNDIFEVISLTPPARAKR